MLKKLSVIICAVLVLTICTPILADYEVGSPNSDCLHSLVMSRRFSYSELDNQKHHVEMMQFVKCSKCSYGYIADFQSYDEAHDFVINNIGCYDSHHIYEVVCSKCSFNQSKVYDCDGNPHVGGPSIIGGMIIWGAIDAIVSLPNYPIFVLP